MSGGRAEREREREKEREKRESQAGCTEPDAGLKPMNREIIHDLS